jgi:three-Cys-motif partner protein
MLAYLEEQKANLAPTFAFVDPFGVKGLPMDLLRRLLSFDRCELLVYFDFNTVNRFATSGVIDDRLTELFGTDLYKQAEGLTGDERKAFLHDLYQSQLMEVCGFSFVKSFEMVGNRGKTGYYLFYGTRNIKGLEVQPEPLTCGDRRNIPTMHDHGRVASTALPDLQSATELADTAPPRIIVQGHRAPRPPP